MLVTAQQENCEFSDYFFPGLFGGVSFVCLNFGFGGTFFPGFVILISETTRATSSADKK